MYGLVDLEIVKEIARLMRRDKDNRQASEVKPIVSTHLIENAQEKPTREAQVERGQQRIAAKS